MLSALDPHDDHLVFIRGRSPGLDDARRLGRQAFLLHKDGRLCVHDRGATQTRHDCRTCDCDVCRPAGTRSEGR